MFEELVNVKMLDKMLREAKTDTPKQQQNNKNKVVIGAVYFLYNSEDKIIYVGKAKNLAHRLSQHRTGKASTKDFYREVSYATYIEIESPSLRTCLEGLFIQYLQPKRNGEVNNTRKQLKKLSIEEVREIKTSLMGGETPKQLSKRFSVVVETIHHIIAGSTWQGVSVEGFEEWASTSKGEKIVNSRASSFSYDMIKEIFRLRHEEKRTYELIAKEVGTSTANIGFILNGKRYSYLYEEMCELFNVNTTKKNAA
ncbi:GIY-YIG nuclease family protein [Priestia megaterium]